MKMFRCAPPNPPPPTAPPFRSRGNHLYFACVFMTVFPSFSLNRSLLSLAFVILGAWGKNVVLLGKLVGRRELFFGAYLASWPLLMLVSGLFTRFCASMFLFGHRVKNYFVLAGFFSFFFLPLLPPFNILFFLCVPDKADLSVRYTWLSTPLTFFFFRLFPLRP